MARLDGLGEDVEEKIGKLAGEVNNLEVKMTKNVTALGQYLITTKRRRKILFRYFRYFRKTAESRQG